MVQNQNIISQIAGALYAALNVDLPAIQYRPYLPKHRSQGLSAEDIPLASRRPAETEVDVHSFQQTWGSTALGFGGLAGQAISAAQTTVVTCRATNTAAVYFGSRLAYVIQSPTPAFDEDLKARKMASCAQAHVYGDLIGEQG